MNTIDKIRAEIERLKGICTAQIKENPGQTFPFVMVMTGYDNILYFLSTLEPEKPISQNENFEKEIADYWTTMGWPKVMTLAKFKVIARYFYGLGLGVNDKSEKPIPKDLEEAAKKYCPDDAYPFGPAIINRDIRLAFIAGAKWQKEQDEEEQADLFTIVALDAAQRAKEQMMKDGLDAVKSGQSNKIEKTIAGVFVKYGMDRQKEMMMKEAIHYVVQDDLDSHGASYNIPFIRIGTTALKPKGIGVGDKVRIIIVKEEKK